MNLREVVRTLRFERRRPLAQSRVCDPVFAKDYERTARALGIAADIVAREGAKHRRKDSQNGQARSQR